jgi:hypothetical protein
MWTSLKQLSDGVPIDRSEMNQARHEFAQAGLAQPFTDGEGLEL